MQEIIDNLVLKIKNKTIRLRDFSDILVEEKIDNSIKFISLLSENSDINNYLASFFNNSKYTEEEIIKKYGEIDGNILVSYAIIKNLIKEEIIDYKDIDVKGLSSLNLFFKDINDLPILSREDTLKYVKRYQESKELGNENLCEHYRNLVIEGNIRLIVYVAKSFASPDMPLVDLINEGFFGINVAIDYYDFNYGCAFSTYAIFWIKQKIMRSIHNNGRSIRIPVHIQMKYNKYVLTRTELSNKLGRSATNEEIAIAMGESIQNIDNLINYFLDVTSLDSKLSDDTETDKYNFIESKSSSFEEDVINKETVLKLMSCLTEKQKDIIIKRYIQDYTLDAVGKMYGITRERVRQIENKSLLKMRNYSKTKVSEVDKNEEKLILDGKTLKEIIGEVKVSNFNSYVQRNSKLKTLYFMAFGENLDKVYDDSNLNKDEIQYLKSSIKKIMRTNNVGIAKKYDNKTLEGIFRLVSNLSYENIKRIKNEWWNKAMMDNNDTTEVLIKAFGIDGDKPCALNVLSFDEKVKLRAKLDYWTYRLNEKDKKKRKQSYDYKTLNEILGLSYEDTIYFVNTLDKDSQTYNIIINVFGNDLKGCLEKDKLEKEVYTKLLSNLNNMKKIINGNNVYKNKYLSDIVSIDLDKIKTYVNEEKLVILKKAFGENLDRRFINTVSVKVLTKVINNLNKQIKEEVKMKSETKANRGKKSMYENMTLDEILDISYEEVLDVFNKVKKDTSIYKVFVKVFGEDFKGIFNISNLDTNEKITLYSKINSLKKVKNNSKDKKSMYENMTLDEILGISYEEVLDAFNKVKKDTSIYKVFVKVFGKDFKGIFNISNLDTNEKITLYSKINSLKKVKNNSKDKKSIYENMTLDEILGISYEEVLDIFNETRKETKIYKIFAKAFGEDFKGKFDLSQLEHNEKIMLYNKINRLKKKFLGNLENKKTTKKENDDLNKYYITIISLMPKEYKTILSLYFENFSLDKIANLMDLDINDVNNRLKEGILFIEKIISLYNKTFDEKIPENEKVLR